MKKMLLSLALILSANGLEINHLRTELYSKNGVNVLKKIDLSLEFEGENLELRKSQIIDSVNTVISGFFYEDIFTELGKNNFKKTLEKFMEKKYKLKVDAIYILSLSGVEKFDIEEFKKFLQSTEAEKKSKENKLKEILDSIEVPDVKEAKVPAVPKIPQNFSDNNTDINLQNLNNSKNTPELEEKKEPVLNQDFNKSKNDFEQNSSEESLKQNLDPKLDENESLIL